MTTELELVAEVVRRAVLVASWNPDVYVTTAKGAERELQDLRDAVAALNKRAER